MRARAASISMSPSTDGGLRGPMKTPTPSLLLQFEGQKEMAEAMIFTQDGGPLEPGETHRARLDFWTEASADEARPRRPFKLWHGRIVGEGVFD